MDKKLSPHPCRWCGGKVEKPRRTWCSDRCVSEFTNRHHQAAFAKFVWENSYKRCADCHIDLEAYGKLLRSLDFAKREALSKLVGLPISNYWQADHIVPQAFGGDELDPKVNGQVLCHRCHSKKTALDIAAIKMLKKEAACVG